MSRPAAVIVALPAALLVDFAVLLMLLRAAHMGRPAAIPLAFVAGVVAWGLVTRLIDAAMARREAGR